MTGGEIFACAAMLAGAVALVCFVDFIRRNAPEALSEIVGDVIELPPEVKAGSSKRLTGETVGTGAGPSGRHEFKSSSHEERPL